MSAMIDKNRVESIVVKKKVPMTKLYGVFEAHGATLYYDARSLFVFD